LLHQTLTVSVSIHPAPSILQWIADWLSAQPEIRLPPPSGYPPPGPLRPEAGGPERNPAPARKAFDIPAVTAPSQRWPGNIGHQCCGGQKPAPSAIPDPLARIPPAPIPPAPG